MSIISKKTENHLRELKIATQIAIAEELGENTIEISIRIVPKDEKTINNYISEVKKICLQNTKYSIEDIDGKRRFGELVKRRQIAQVIIKKTMPMSKVNVAQVFGGRDHSTYINSEMQVNNQYKLYPEYRELYDTLYSKALKLKGVII